jgi:hypothetical protein
MLQEILRALTTAKICAMNGWASEIYCRKANIIIVLMTRYKEVYLE